MARRKEGRRGNLPVIVTVLVAVVVAFCVLTSWEDKNGNGVKLFTYELPSIDFVSDLLGEFEPAVSGSADEALQVDSPLAGAQLEVHILDMGQADSILIKGPKANVLIDAGENNQGQQVLRYLNAQGVTRLDTVIGTHPHSDHIGGLDLIIKEMQVSNVILPTIPDGLAPTTQTYTDLLLAIGEKGLTITPAKRGDTLDLGDGAIMKIIGPVAEYSDLNNMSVVTKLTYGSTSFLFTGDTCEGAESDILSSGESLKADVLDVGHHGSNTSTCDAFLQAVSPRIATISCGIDNSYGHPHREIIEKLELRDIRILRTDLNGVIVIVSDGERLGVSTQK